MPGLTSGSPDPFRISIQKADDFIARLAFGDQNLSQFFGKLARTQNQQARAMASKSNGLVEGRLDSHTHLHAVIREGVRSAREPKPLMALPPCNRECPSSIPQSGVSPPEWWASMS